MRRGGARYEAALCRRRYHREVEAMADSLNVRRLLRMLRTFMTVPPLRRRIFDSTVAESIAVRGRDVSAMGAEGRCLRGPEGVPGCALRAVCVMVRVGAHDSERMDARERVCACA